MILGLISPLFIRTFKAKTSFGMILYYKADVKSEFYHRPVLTIELMFVIMKLHIANQTRPEVIPANFLYTLWQRLKQLLRDTSAVLQLPKNLLKEYAMFLVPEIRKFYKSEEGRQYYAEWLKKHPEFQEQEKPSA